MADTLQSVFDLPDVSFIDNDTLDAMMQRMITAYETKYKELTGKKISLAMADPNRILLYAAALELFQTECYVDRAGKQDLLKYSYDEFLDNLAAGRGVTRQRPAAAVTTLRFTLSEARTYAVGIPAGTRVSNSDGIYFATTEYGEVPIGGLYIDIPARCTTNGAVGNGLVAGQVATMADPLGYVESAENITTTSGGADLELDSSLAERIFLAPSSYSTAGPEDAYTYWTRTYNTEIASVKPVTPQPGYVTVYILMADGSLPEQEVIDGLQEFLRDDNVRPMTDLVTVSAPGVKTFDIDLTYYIAQSNKASALTIQAEVNTAIQDYIRWQTTEIGRDINPSELIRRIREAGAKRVEVRSPVFDTVADTETAQLGTSAPIYGGLEDD